jgi:hypothetical protein
MFVGRMRLRWSNEGCAGGPHARLSVMASCRAYIGAQQADRSVRTHDIEQRSIVYEKCGNDACDINGNPRQHASVYTHHNQRRLGGLWPVSNNFGTLE